MSLDEFQARAEAIWTRFEEEMAKVQANLMAEVGALAAEIEDEAPERRTAMASLLNVRAAAAQKKLGAL